MKQTEISVLLIDEGDKCEAERQRENLYLFIPGMRGSKKRPAQLSISRILPDHTGLNPAMFAEDPLVRSCLQHLQNNFITRTGFCLIF